MVVIISLCVPSMDHNLVPPFFLREAGLILNDKPNINCENPNVEDNSILDEETGLRLKLGLVYTDKRGRKCMCAEAKKAIYGTLEASLLFWDFFPKKLRRNRIYQRNEYTWCIMNKIIDDKKCTILWHINDLKTSHVDPTIISNILACIDAEYGKIAKMTTTWGKVHKYLGTTID